MNDTQSTVDVLALGAHHEDADLGIGGTLLALARQGFTTGIIDLTEGELGSRGTPGERVDEGQGAARRLGLSHRSSARLPDGGIQNIDSQRRALIPIIRTLRPKVLLVHQPPDRHPDHIAAAQLSRDANFFAGVTSIGTGHEPYRAPTVIGFRPYYDDAHEPELIMDISDVFEQKIEALRAYKSQFYNPDYQGPQTFIASEGFWQSIESRARYWGNRAGFKFGEPLFYSGPLPVRTLAGLGGTE